jgi:hypothetical protein
MTISARRSSQAIEVEELAMNIKTEIRLSPMTLR